MDTSPPRAPWRFVRRERGKLIAGVTTGMADAFHIDVVVMRVIWVVAAVASFGLGVAAYAICWIAFPSDQHPAPITEIRHHRHTAGFVAGLALLGLGLVIVFSEAVPPFRHGGDVAWATVLIGGGLAVLFLRHPEDDQYRGGAPPVAPTDRPEPTGATGSPDAPTTEIPTAPTSVDEPPTAGPPPPPSAWTQSAPWPEPPRPRPRRPRRRPFLTPLTLSVLLIGAGIVALLDNAGATHVTVAETLAGGVAVIGVALIASAWFGRARGLIPIGIVLLLATPPAAALDVPITGGIGHRTYAPTTRAELRSRYELGIGRLEVDLLAAPLTQRKTHVTARLGIGELTIDVPSTVRVVVHGHAGAGSVRVFGSGDGGWPENATRTAPGTKTGELDIDARVGAGDIQVRRYEPGGVETLLGGTNQ
jgi:phage shock protein PspC (stress-responsive transcriptional regulator)